MKRKNYDYTKFSRRNCFVRRARWQKVFVFSARWCGDCRYLGLFAGDWAENPELPFVIDRDAYLDPAKVTGCLWDP